MEDNKLPYSARLTASPFIGTCSQWARDSLIVKKKEQLTSFCAGFFCHFGLQLGGYEEVQQSYLGVLARAEEWEKSRQKDNLIRAMAGFFTQLGLLQGARSGLKSRGFTVFQMPCSKFDDFPLGT